MVFLKLHHYVLLHVKHAKHVQTVQEWKLFPYDVSP